ncbi:MAG TPA: DUF488 domain-containing protein [Phycisphaerae bacterium]|nr:DUF488 domain-containing protein [Phycisphaerae bacterium]
MSEAVNIFTIGFTRKTAEEFFCLLEEAGVKRVIDTRLNNISQLAGFAKKDDLRFFLKRVCNIDYVHMPELAPTQEMLDAFKKEKGEWADYEKKFVALITQRQIETKVPREVVHMGCLLCSEETPEHCHRRLVAEYLKRAWGDVEIVHLT